MRNASDLSAPHRPGNERALQVRPKFVADILHSPAVELGSATEHRARCLFIYGGVMVGESGRTIQYPKSAPEALADLERAFSSIGKVVEVSKLTASITGRTRYGLQSVKLRVSVLSLGTGRSTIQIQGSGNDIWGAGARKGTDKLIRALESLA